MHPARPGRVTGHDATVPATRGSRPRAARSGLRVALPSRVKVWCRVCGTCSSWLASLRSDVRYGSSTWHSHAEENRDVAAPAQPATTSTMSVISHRILGKCKVQTRNDAREPPPPLPPSPAGTRASACSSDASVPIDPKPWRISRQDAAALTHIFCAAQCSADHALALRRSDAASGVAPVDPAAGGSATPASVSSGAAASSRRHTARSRPPSPYGRPFHGRISGPSAAVSRACFSFCVGLLRRGRRVCVHRCICVEKRFGVCVCDFCVCD